MESFPTREEVFGWVSHARDNNLEIEDYVSQMVDDHYPGLKNQVIRRGGDTFNAYEFLMSDIHTYG